MRTHLFALAATLSIAGLIAAPWAGATSPPSGGGSGGGGGHASGGSSGGGHSGGGGSSGGGYRGGGYGGAAFHANYMAHGGYVAHGSFVAGGSPLARGGYRIIGSQSAGVAHTSAMPQSSHSARITLALGPRTGSASTAMRLDSAVHADRMHPRPGHAPGPRHPRHHNKYATSSYPQQYSPGIPFYCDNRLQQPPRSEPSSGCLTPAKEHAGRKVASGL